MANNLLLVHTFFLFWKPTLFGRKWELMSNLKRLKLSFAIAAILIVGGLFTIIYSRDKQSTIVTAAPTQAQINNAKSVRQAIAQTPSVISGDPMVLAIPSLSLNLAVTPGIYDAQTQQWTLTNDKVQYAVITPQPNTQSGNTFFYGHYRKGVFSTLHHIPMGAEADVMTTNGKTFVYKLSEIQVVSPNDSAAIFNYQGAPILTIQTCTGLFFQNRQLFIFNLEKVS